MPVVSRGAVLVATASMAAALLAGPGVAFAADSTTQLSAGEMATELKAVSTASARAAAQGWKATAKLSAGSMTTSEFFAGDPATGVTYERIDVDGMTSAYYSRKGKGTCIALTDPASRAALRMIGRPEVRYVYVADKTTEDSGVSPGEFLADDLEHAGTRTVHDDGSADYRLTEDGTAVTLHVTAAGTLAGAGAKDDDIDMRFTFAYGPQHVTLPSASVTIGAAVLDRAMAYLTMATTVKQVAGQAAADTLEAAHGHRVSTSLLRSVTRDDARAANEDVEVTLVKTRSAGAGVRVYATNPWTHRTVSYTLQPSGRKVTIARN